jgi:hypothetical protein
MVLGMPPDGAKPADPVAKSPGLSKERRSYLYSGHMVALQGCAPGNAGCPSTTVHLSAGKTTPRRTVHNVVL